MTNPSPDLRRLRAALTRVIELDTDGMCIVDEPLIGAVQELVNQAPDLLAAIDQLEKLR